MSKTAGNERGGEPSRSGLRAESGKARPGGSADKNRKPLPYYSREGLAQ